MKLREINWVFGGFWLGVLIVYSGWYNLLLSALGLQLFLTSYFLGKERGLWNSPLDIFRFKWLKHPHQEKGVVKQGRDKE